MPLNRRDALRLTAAALGTGAVMSGAARAATSGGQSYSFGGNDVTVFPVNHASLALQSPQLVVYVDPVGPVDAYADLPAPDYILITHQHGDHYNAETLSGLVADGTKLIVNPAVHELLPNTLKARATAIANGESTALGPYSVDAIPAYNTTLDRQQYHPQGRDNGYVISLDGARVYIAGDTEDTPEMRALIGIDLAFLPMNLPYTMTIDQAAAAVAAFQPGVVYPYHYKGSDTAGFADLVKASGANTEVVLYDWYA